MWANCEEWVFCFVLVLMPLTDILASGYFADSVVLIPQCFEAGGASWLQPGFLCIEAQGF